MDELSPEEIQLRANQVTDEVNTTGIHMGLQYVSNKIRYLLKIKTDQDNDSANL